MALKAKQLACGNFSSGCLLDSQSQSQLGMDLPRKNPAYMRSPTRSNRCSELALCDARGLQDFDEVSHTYKIATILQDVKSPTKGSSGREGYNSCMTNWIYRDAFDARYQEYRDRTGETVQEVAAHFSKSYSTLNSWRRKSGGSIPPKDALFKAAELFGCSVFEFMDDDSILATIPGSGDVSELDRSRMLVAARPFGRGSDLTEDEKVIAAQEIEKVMDLIYKIRRMNH